MEKSHFGRARTERFPTFSYGQVVNCQLLRLLSTNILIHESLAVNLSIKVNKILHHWILLLNVFCLHFTTRVFGHSAISLFLCGLGSERHHQEIQRLPRHRESKGLQVIEKVINSKGGSYFYSVGSERRHQESQRFQVIEKVRDSESLRSHTLRIIEKVRDSKSRRKSGTPSDMRARERDSMHNRKNLETDKTPLASAVEQTLR